MAIQYHIFSSALGQTLGGISPSGICFLEFGESPESLEKQLRSQFPNEEARLVSEHEHHLFPSLKETINDAIRGQFGGIMTLPLDTRGSGFQRMVWDHLRSIPPGEVRSYAEVAHALAIPRSTRAVANACGANCIAILIPCHRVVRSDGSLGGYRWGIQAKRLLLTAERALTPTDAEPLPRL